MYLDGLQQYLKLFNDFVLAHTKLRLTLWRVYEHLVENDGNSLNYSILGIHGPLRYLDWAMIA